jgi:hypothetical protein
MAGEQVYEVITRVKSMSEGVPKLLAAWRTAGLLPARRNERHQWFREVMEALKRAYHTPGNEEWAKEHLIQSRDHGRLEHRVAAAMLQLPRIHSRELEESDLDSKNLELLSRGKPMQSDEAAADATLADDAEPRLVEIADEGDHVGGEEESQGEEEQQKNGRSRAMVECAEHKGCFYPNDQGCAMCAIDQQELAHTEDEPLQPSPREDEPSEVERLRKSLLKAKKKAKKAKRSKNKSKRSKWHSDSSTDSSSDSETDDSSEDDCRSRTVKEAVSGTLSKILTHNLTQSRMRPIEAGAEGGDYMTLRVNTLLQRNEQIVYKLQKLARKEDDVALMKARMLAEEHERNGKELDLLERGLEEAKVNPELAKKTVALVTKDRLRVSSESREWTRAQKHLRHKERSELTHRMLYGRGSYDQGAPLFDEWEQHQPDWRPRKGPRTGPGGKGGGGKGGRTRPLDAPIVSKGDNLEIGPWLPDAERRERTDIQCNYCGGPHSGSWECSAPGAPRWKFKQGQVDKWNQPVHSRQR